MNGMMQSHRRPILMRDWRYLSTLNDLPSWTKEVAHDVKKSEELHDKFWRYMELFVKAT